LRPDKTGIFVPGILGKDPFVVNYGDYRNQSGNFLYRAFQIAGKAYIIGEENSTIVLARTQRSPFYDTDKLTERVVMEGEREELLDAFLNSGYQLI